MAKKRSNQGRRARSLSATDNWSVLADLAIPRPSKPLQLIEDSRTYHPDRVRSSPRNLTGRPARIVSPNPQRVRRSRPVKRTVQRLAGLFFQTPAVVRCIRRKQRKQVLHAKKIAGRSGLRPPRRNFWSNVFCR